MRLDFNAMAEAAISNLNHGRGTVRAKMFMDQNNKIMISVLPPGTSIGTHRHETSSEMNYVISGRGRAVCDTAEEDLHPGVCHYCPKGASHGIMNTGEEDLVLFTVVPEQ